MRSSLFDGQGFAEHQPTGRGILVKMFITLEPHVSFLDQMLHYLFLLHYPATGMQNGDQNHFGGIGIFVKMLIPLELNDIF